MNIKQVGFPTSQFIQEEHPKAQIYLHHTAGGPSGEQVFVGWASNPERIATCVSISGKGTNCVDGTGWNYNGPIICAPMRFSNNADTLNYVLGRVKEAFYPFNIVVTKDSLVYQAAVINRRTKIICTPTYQWYGVTGGVSFIGSGYWGDDTPGFVFWPVGAQTQ